MLCMLLFKCFIAYTTYILHHKCSIHIFFKCYIVLKVIITLHVYIYVYVHVLWHYMLYALLIICAKWNSFVEMLHRRILFNIICRYMYGYELTQWFKYLCCGWTKVKCAFFLNEAMIMIFEHHTRRFLFSNNNTTKHTYYMNKKDFIFVL